MKDFYFKGEEAGTLLPDWMQIRRFHYSEMEMVAVLLSRTKAIPWPSAETKDVFGFQGFPVGFPLSLSFLIDRSDKEKQKRRPRKNGRRRRPLGTCGDQIEVRWMVSAAVWDIIYTWYCTYIYIYIHIYMICIHISMYSTYYICMYIWLCNIWYGFDQL